MSNKLEVLITVKAYPNPSKTLGEAACIAGVSREGNFVRLYPVPFRDLDDDKRFHKYQWIKVNARKPKDDSRPETLRPDFSTIEVMSDIIPTGKHWEIAELWRKDRRSHDQETTIGRVKHRFFDEMCAAGRDTHFFTGNMALHQSSFLVLGVFWPKRDHQPSLF